MTDRIRAYIASAFESVIFALEAFGLRPELAYRIGDGEHAARLSYHDGGRPLAAIVTVEDDVPNPEKAWWVASVLLVDALPDGLDEAIPALLESWIDSGDVDIELIGGVHDGLVRPVAVTVPWAPPRQCWVGPVAAKPVGAVISAGEEDMPDGVVAYVRDRVDRATLRWRYVPAGPARVMTPPIPFE